MRSVSLMTMDDNMPGMDDGMGGMDDMNMGGSGSSGGFCSGMPMAMYMDGFTWAYRATWWAFSPATTKRHDAPSCLNLFSAAIPSQTFLLKLRGYT